MKGAQCSRTETFSSSLCIVPKLRLVSTMRDIDFVPNFYKRECLAAGKLETAASYLIILQNLEQPAVSKQVCPVIILFGFLCYSTTTDRYHGLRSTLF